MQSRVTWVSFPPGTRRIDDHDEWTGVPPTRKACRSRQRAPGRMGTVRVRGGALLPCWAGKLGALKANFKNISNNDCVSTDATQVSGVSSGYVLPASLLAPATRGSCPVSLVSASGPPSPRPLRSDPVPLPTHSYLPRAPPAHRPTRELSAPSAAACSPSAGGWGFERSVPPARDTLPSALWTVDLQEGHSEGPSSVFPAPPPCQTHARGAVGASKAPEALAMEEAMDFPNLLPLCKRPIVAEHVPIVQLKQRQETEPKQVSSQPWGWRVTRTCRGGLCALPASCVPFTSLGVGQGSRPTCVWSAAVSSSVWLDLTGLLSQPPLQLGAAVCYGLDGVPKFSPHPSTLECAWRLELGPLKR